MPLTIQNLKTISFDHKISSRRVIFTSDHHLPGDRKHRKADFGQEKAQKFIRFQREAVKGDLHVVLGDFFEGWQFKLHKILTENRDIIDLLLDSNALFVPLQFEIDIIEQTKKLLNKNLELILLSPIRQEIEELAEKGSPKMRKNASYALRMAEKCKLIELGEKYADFSPDDAIFNVAREWKCPVFTNDRQLRKRLRNINVPVIYVRQKSRLEIDGRI